MGWKTILVWAGLGLVACSTGSPSSSSDGGSPEGAIADAGDVDGSNADGGNGGAPYVTYPSLSAAHDALQSGATDVAVSADGREHYVRMLGGNGDETDELRIDGVVVYRAVHSGSTSHVEQDQNGDGAFDWSLDVVRGATDDDRQAVILSDPSGTGAPTGRTTMTQTAATPDTVHTKVEAFHSGSWLLVEETDAPVVQGVEPAVLVDTLSCDPLSSTIQSAMEQAITDGVAQMQSYRVDDIVNGIVALIAERGVHIVCDPAVYNARHDCAEASIFDSLTHSRLGGLFSSRVTINLAPRGDCVRPFALFHELLHIVTGKWHSLPIKANDKEWKAEDRIYSCTDVAFEADNNTKPTTKCECATCLKTSMDDPRCATFDACPADIVITSAKCVASGTCDCGGIYAGNLDTIEVSGFAHGPPTSQAVVPNLTLNTADETVDCGGWTWVKDVVAGQGTPCVRDPDAHSRTEWSMKGKAQSGCACNTSGTPMPVGVSLFLGKQMLAWDQTQVTCP